MSSIITAFKNISSDSAWFLKLVIMAVPVFFLTKYCLGSNIIFDFKHIPTICSGFFSKVIQPDILPMFLVGLVLYIGCGTFMLNRHINNTFPILPNLFGLIDLLKHSLFSVFLILPGVVLCALVINIVATHLFYELKQMIIIYSLIVIFFLPFIFIPLCLYAIKGGIRGLKDAFNLKPVYSGAGNFIVAMLSFLIQYIFTLLIIWLLFFLTFAKALTDNTLIIAINSFFIVYTFFLFFSYLADEFGESIPDPRVVKDL